MVLIVIANILRDLGQCQIMYFLVTAFPPKPLDEVFSNFAGALYKAG